jgi:Flp pilus assembly protein TadB
MKAFTTALVVALAVPAAAAADHRLSRSGGTDPRHQRPAARRPGHRRRRARPAGAEVPVTRRGLSRAAVHRPHRRRVRLGRRRRRRGWRSAARDDLAGRRTDLPASPGSVALGDRMSLAPFAAAAALALLCGVTVAGADHVPEVDPATVPLGFLATTTMWRTSRYSRCAGSLARRAGSTRSSSTSS